MRRSATALAALLIGSNHAHAHHPLEGLPWADAIEHLLEWDHLAMAAAAVVAGWLIYRKLRHGRFFRSA